MIERSTYERMWTLEDITISRASGDGRTVEAYASIFNVPTEIHDQQGAYVETIDPTAFNRTLKRGADRVQVYYNHGMTIYGTPSDTYSVPIGRAIQIKPDSRGLHTITRYNPGETTDQILDAIRNGAIRGYSFRGKIYRSDPNTRQIRPNKDGSLQTVRRLELGLMEYGPTPSPAYMDAAILAVRSGEQAAAKIVSALADAQKFIESSMAAATPSDPAVAPTTPTMGPGTADSHNNALRAAQLRLKSELRSRGV